MRGFDAYTGRVQLRQIRLCCALALAASLASCKRAPTATEGDHFQFGSYQDSEGNYRFEAPLGWQPSTEERVEKPAASVFFRGYEPVNGQEVPIDAAVLVSKLPRRPEFFGSREDFERFRRTTLLQVDALFGPPSPELQEPLRSLIAKNTKDITVAGIPGKTYHRDYDYVDPKGPPGSKPLPISLEEIVLKTPDAYYVLEYRARRDLFDKYHFAADRLKSTFQPGSAS